MTGEMSVVAREHEWVGPLVGWWAEWACWRAGWWACQTAAQLDEWDLRKAAQLDEWGLRTVDQRAALKAGRSVVQWVELSAGWWDQRLTFF